MQTQHKGKKNIFYYVSREFKKFCEICFEFLHVKNFISCHEKKHVPSVSQVCRFSRSKSVTAY